MEVFIIVVVIMCACIYIYIYIYRYVTKQERVCFFLVHFSHYTLRLCLPSKNQCHWTTGVINYIATDRQLIF